MINYQRIITDISNIRFLVSVYVMCSWFVINERMIHLSKLIKLQKMENNNFLLLQLLTHFFGSSAHGAASKYSFQFFN